jgi:hypothetical protein
MKDNTKILLAVLCSIGIAVINEVKNRIREDDADAESFDYETSYNAEYEEYLRHQESLIE